VVGRKINLDDVDELRIIGTVLSRTHIAINLIPPGMLHGLALAEFPAFLPLAHGRVVPCKLANAAGPEDIEA
jgi:hypothetical protein